MNKMYIDGAEFTPNFKIDNLSFEEGKVPDYVTSIHAPLSTSAEMSFECEVNAPLFAKLIGVDLSSCGDMSNFTLTCKAPYEVQVRRHKKKRINKKWAKRYGYKIKFKSIQIVDVNIEQKDYEFEFTGRHAYVL